MNDLTIIPTSSELEQMILAESDPSKLDGILDVFKAYDKKREMLKILKIGRLQEQVLDQMETNLEVPGEVSDRDLVTYLKVLSDAESRPNTQKFDGVMRPTIQINQQFNGDSSGGLSKESRDNVISFINGLLYADNKTDNIEDEIKKGDE